MRNIVELLKRYKSLTPPQGAARKELKRILASTVSVYVEESDISVTRGVATVSAHGAHKQNIFMHKKKILDALEESLGTGVINDVR